MYALSLEIIWQAGRTVGRCGRWWRANQEAQEDCQPGCTPHSYVTVQGRGWLQGHKGQGPQSKSMHCMGMSGITEVSSQVAVQRVVFKKITKVKGHVAVSRSVLRSQNSGLCMIRVEIWLSVLSIQAWYCLQWAMINVVALCEDRKWLINGR